MRKFVRISGLLSMNSLNGLHRNRNENQSCNGYISSNLKSRRPGFDRRTRAACLGSRNPNRPAFDFRLTQLTVFGLSFTSELHSDR